MVLATWLYSKTEYHAVPEVIVQLFTVMPSSESVASEVDARSIY